MVVDERVVIVPRWSGQAKGAEPAELAVNLPAELAVNLLESAVNLLKSAGPAVNLKFEARHRPLGLDGGVPFQACTLGPFFVACLGSVGDVRASIFLSLVSSSPLHWSLVVPLAS